jgi:sugar lactone lactonase YvrE
MIGGGLKTPSQMAVDAVGNLYVADSGLGAVEMYPTGSASGVAGTSVGTGLKAPTGVAVDGAGDVFIADSGSVYEVPETASGLNSKGQITLQTGLGSHVQLAADSLGNLFVSDADNKAVYELENFSTGWNTSLPGVLSPAAVTLSGTAFSTPSVIAVDSNDNLYVVNGGNLYEVTPGGSQSQVLTGLAGVTGLTIDPSGSAYIAMAGGTIRVPYVSGNLNLAAETSVASGVTAPSSVVLDRLGNIYVADSTALNIDMTSASTSIQFGTLTADPYPAPSAGSSSTQTATLVNYGNAPLQVTGYTNTLDYSETSDTCSAGPVAVNASCTVTVTFSAGIGDGGDLAGVVLVKGNIGNSPVGVNGTGTAPTLAGSATVMTVATNGSIEGVPVTVNVAPNPASTQQLTGTVTLTIVPSSNVQLTNPAPQDLSITLPLTDVENTTGGTVSFSPTGLSIGTYQFIATYNGDATYIYEHSSISGSVSVPAPVGVSMTPGTLTASSGIPAISYTLPCTSGAGSTCTTSYNYGQPASNPPGYLVLAGEGCETCGGAESYDGSSTQWEYTYPVTVAPAATGFTMIGTAAYNYSATPPSENGWNFGSVNYLEDNGHSLCGDGATSASIVNLDATGAAPIATKCALINTSNNTIPDLMTYYTITPTYTGSYNNLQDINPNYTKATGTSFSIWAMRNPVIQISSTPASLTVAPGSSVSATLTLTSVLGYGYAGRFATQNNWSLPVDLQCQGLPAYATCTFTYPTPNPADPNLIPDPVKGVINVAGLQCATSTPAAPVYCAIDIGPDPGSVLTYGTVGHTVPTGAAATQYPCTPRDGCLGAGTVGVTINTNVGTNSSAKLDSGKSSLALSALFGLGFLGFAFRKRASRFGYLATIICLLLLGSALSGFTACSTKTLGVNSGNVTPTGSYWVTVVARETGSLLVGSQGATGDPAATPAPKVTTVYGNGNLVSLPYTVNLTVK